MSATSHLDQAAGPADHDLVLFALICLAAMRAGVIEQTELLQVDEAVRGFQLLAERDDLAELDADDTVARLATVWERYAPRGRAFKAEWVAELRSERRALGDALALATATVNYWERGPSR